MAKKSKKRLGRREKDQAGCMWSLLNIFDFRHVHPSQKLILDKKRGSKRLDEAVCANIELELLSESCQICEKSSDTVQNETLTIDASKMSVKELMEEEMCGEQDTEKQTTNDKGPVKKTRRWDRNKMSLDLEADGFVLDGDLIKRPNHRKHKSCSSVDLKEMVEELCKDCNQIQQKDIRNSKPNKDSIDVEKQLGEAAKVLVKHFTDGKTGTKERKMQPSKELSDALQMLNSNKELFLKLLQDPNSQLVKHIQSLQDIQIEEGKFNVLTGSDLLAQDVTNSKQPNFFWRKFNGQERNSSRKIDTSVDLSRIVVLKPGLPSSKSSDIVSTCSSLPESPKSISDKDEIHKPSTSPFTFAEFKRRLKHAMRREQREVSHQPSDVQTNIANRDKRVGVESIAMASPSRDHFLNDRLPKSPVSFRKGKEGNIPLEHDLGLTPEQRVSSIYIEAKKHLAEIVGNSDVDLVDTSGRRRPKSLGRILSYSGYNSPTICSPRTDADIRFSLDLEELNVNFPYHVKQEPENESCIPSDKSICDHEISDALPHKNDAEKHVHKSDVPSSEEVMIAVDAASPKESNLLEISVQSHSSQDVIKTDQNINEENEHSSGPDSSTLDYSLSGKIEDADAMSDVTSKPSPISVLEPIFREDDISPAVIKHFSAIEPIQPRQIKFEEEISAQIGRVPSTRTDAEYDKYTFDFVRDVIQMSGLSWTELLRRSLFADEFIDPSLIDEVDFLPELLSCDFNLLFDLINEVVIELCWLKFGCVLSLETTFVEPSLKVYNEVWKGVNWYLKLEAPLRTLDQIIGKDLAKPAVWADVRLDCENIGIQIQDAILDELVEETISSCVYESLVSEVPILSSTEEEGVIVES